MWLRVPLSLPKLTLVIRKVLSRRPPLWRLAAAGACFSTQSVSQGSRRLYAICVAYRFFRNALLPIQNSRMNINPTLRASEFAGARLRGGEP